MSKSKCHVAFAKTNVRYTKTAAKLIYFKTCVVCVCVCVCGIIHKIKKQIFKNHGDLSRLEDCLLASVCYIIAIIVAKDLLIDFDRRISTDNTIYLV